MVVNNSDVEDEIGTSLEIAKLTREDSVMVGNLNMKLQVLIQIETSTKMYTPFLIGIN